MKIPWEQSRAGSSPATRTQQFVEYYIHSQTVRIIPRCNSEGIQVQVLECKAVRENEYGNAGKSIVALVKDALKQAGAHGV